MTPALAQQFAEYNRRMNRKIYAVAAQLTDEERRRERGAFFGSLHGTLNHLAWADNIWLSRFEGQPSPGGTFNTEMAADFATLVLLRNQLDERIVAFAAELTDARLAQSFTWKTTQGATRSAPLYILVAHLFNHQTHHRGQASTLVSQMNKDLGSTDLPFVLLEP